MGAEEVVRVLAVSPAEEDHRALSHVFSHSKWQIEGAYSCRDVSEFLHRQVVPVIICSCELPDGNWKTILQEAAAYANPPRVIVASPLADDTLWAEVLDLGGYDVLGKPFEVAEVVRVVSLAWRQWKHDHEQMARRPVKAGGSQATPGVHKVGEA